MASGNVVNASGITQYSGSYYQAQSSSSVSYNGAKATVSVWVWCYFNEYTGWSDSYINIDGARRYTGNLAPSPSPTGNSSSCYYSYEVTRGTSAFTSSCGAAVNAGAGESTLTQDTYIAALDYYTITYDSNGGTSTPKDQGKWYGKNITLAAAISHNNVNGSSYTVKFNGNGVSNPSSKTSQYYTTYTFSKWKDSSGNTYSGGGTYSANSGTKMTAQWTTKSVKPAITLPSVSRTGYVFNGWYNSSGKYVGTSGSSYTPSSNETLTASWTAQASTIAECGSATIGNNCRIVWTPYNTSFQYKLFFCINDTCIVETDYISPGTTSQYSYTGYEFELGTWGPQIAADATTGIVSVLLRTYNGTTQLGDDSWGSFYLSIPEIDTTKPTITDLKLSANNNYFENLYVSTISDIKAICTGESKSDYNATIKDFTVVCSFEENGVVRNYTYSGSPSTATSSGSVTLTSDTIPTVTNTTGTIVTTITDSRGFTNSRTDYITIIPYTTPYIKAFRLVNGVESVTVSTDFVISPVNDGTKDKNTHKITILRSDTDSETPTVIASNVDTGSFSTFTIVDKTATEIKDKTYTYSVYVADTVGKSTVKTRATAIICISRKAGGTGVTLFGEAEKDGFVVNGNAEITGSLNGTEVGDNPKFTDTTYEDATQEEHGLMSTSDKTKLDDVLNLVYPVGSIYMSINSTDPTTLFGGTWEQIKDTFLLSSGSTYTAGKTGGAATHKTTGSVDSHTLTTSEIPAHTHGSKGSSNNLYAYSWSDGASGGGVSKTTSAKNMSMSAGSDIGYINYSWSNSHTHSSVGGGNGHNHGFTGASMDTMPPYLVVYMWKRTA